MRRPRTAGGHPMTFDSVTPLRYLTVCRKSFSETQDAARWWTLRTSLAPAHTSGERHPTGTCTGTWVVQTSTCTASCLAQQPEQPSTISAAISWITAARISDSQRPRRISRIRERSNATRRVGLRGSTSHRYARGGPHRLRSPGALDTWAGLLPKNKQLTHTTQPLVSYSGSSLDPTSLTRTNKWPSGLHPARRAKATANTVTHSPRRIHTRNSMAGVGAVNVAVSVVANTNDGGGCYLAYHDVGGVTRPSRDPGRLQHIGGAA